MIRVLHKVSIMNRAGQETFIMNVYRNINRNDFDFRFLCSIREVGDYDDEINKLGGKIFYLNTLRHSRGIKRWVEEFKNTAAWYMENRNDFDILHIHTHHALDVFINLLASRKAGIRSVIVHSHNTSAPHPILHKVMRLLCQMFSYVKFGCSEEAVCWLHGKNETDKSVVIYNGIDVKNYLYNSQIAQSKREELGLAGKTVLGHVGRFCEQKNHIFLIDIFDEYLKLDSEAVLLLVGTGELQATIKEKVRDKGIEDQVLFMGVRNDVPELLMAMDAFVFPSLYEGLAIVLVEAQASGLPTTTTTIPKEAFLLKDRMKKLTLKTSASQWAKTLYEQTHKKWDREAANNIVAKSNFDINRVVEIISQQYKSITYDER